MITPLQAESRSGGDIVHEDALFARGQGLEKNQTAQPPRMRV